MNTKNYSRHLFGAVFCAVCFLVATGTSVFAQTSGQTLPFHAEELSITTDGNIWAWNAVSSGKATHLGKTSGSSFNRIVGGYKNPDGSWFLFGISFATSVAANGDELYMTTKWTLDTGDPEDVVYGNWFITGGTGRFENATGEGTTVGRSAGEDSRFFITDGEINY